MIMDFPRKMSPSALESLRTIMKDGPRCGVFTVLVKAGGDAMDLLKDAPLKIANEIIRTPALVYKNGSFYDTYENTFGNFTEEINVDEFDKYTQIYNKRAKNDVQIVIDIDSFDSCCSKLSNFAIIYKLMNNELVLRMYNRFESKYLNEITRKLLEIADN